MTGQFVFPLLMFAVGILRPEDLQHKLRTWVALLPTLQYLQDAWPGVLVDLTTGVQGFGAQLPVPELSPESPGEETGLRKWLANPDLKAQELKTSMQRLADTTQPEWAETTAFRSLISHEEFYIARFLASAELQRPTASSH